MGTLYGKRLKSLAEAKRYLQEQKKKDPHNFDKLDIYHRKGEKSWWVCNSLQWLHFH
jgi:hypothetical protein